MTGKQWRQWLLVIAAVGAATAAGAGFGLALMSVKEAASAQQGNPPPQ